MGRREGMTMDEVSGFQHQPVMAEEILNVFAPVPAGVLFDGTLGGAGHATLILDAYPHLDLVGVDQDPMAIEAASRRLARFGGRARVVRARFDQLDQVLDSLGIGAISGALFDLGVSSPQLDHRERGFSYQGDDRLDMRMDPSRSFSAVNLVNEWSLRDLTELFSDNGETRFAPRIAAAIVAARPIETTGQLAETVRNAIPAAARRHGGHPARRIFQAVRIAVNEELDILPGAIDAALRRLTTAGRCAVLSYHSGEDRIVKYRFIQAATGGCVCPPDLPCVCVAVRSVRLLNRGARKPSPAEVASNRRSESARLRAVEKLNVPEEAR